MRGSEPYFFREKRHVLIPTMTFSAFDEAQLLDSGMLLPVRDSPS